MAKDIYRVYILLSALYTAVFDMEAMSVKILTFQNPEFTGLFFLLWDIFQFIFDLYAQRYIINDFYPPNVMISKDLLRYCTFKPILFYAQIQKKAFQNEVKSI